MESLPVLGQVAIGAPLNAISDVLDQQSKPSSPIEEVPALEPIPTLVQMPMLEAVSSETESKDYTDMPALRALPAPPAPSDEVSPPTPSAPDVLCPSRFDASKCAGVALNSIV